MRLPPRWIGYKGRVTFVRDWRSWGIGLGFGWRPGPWVAGYLGPFYIELRAREES